MGKNEGARTEFFTQPDAPQFLQDFANWTGFSTRKELHSKAVLVSCQHFINPNFYTFGKNYHPIRFLVGIRNVKPTSFVMFNRAECLETGALLNEDFFQCINIDKETLKVAIFPLEYYENMQDAPQVDLERVNPLETPSAGFYHMNYTLKYL